MQECMFAICHKLHSDNWYTANRMKYFLNIKCESENGQKKCVCKLYFSNEICSMGFQIYIMILRIIVSIIRICNWHRYNICYTDLLKYEVRNENDRSWLNEACFSSNGYHRKEIFSIILIIMCFYINQVYLYWRLLLYWWSYIYFRINLK